jgi:integrase
MKAPDLLHLWDRSRQPKQQNWYLRLPIPTALRPQFGNKLSIVRPLDTGDLAVARRKRDELVVGYRHYFDRMLAGEKITPEQIDAALRLDLQAVAEQHKARALQLLPHWLRSIAHTFHPDQMRMRGMFEFEIAEVFKSLGKPTPPPDSDEYKMVRAALERGHQELVEERLRGIGIEPRIPPWEHTPVIEPTTETISVAAEAWFADMQRDATAAVKPSTLDGHRQRVRRFIELCGDIPLVTVTRVMASDFLTKVGTGLSNRTVNNYATTLAGVYESSRHRGRFTGENPFDAPKRKAVGKSYVPFEIPELQKLFDSFLFETKPNKHSPDTALPWVSLIATFTGMRLEEICQLNAADIRDEPANGATVTVIDIHNGGTNHLKNESSVRLVPVHSELVRLGLLRYRDALPIGSALFPGLTRRASKGGKIGARIGELFRDQLKALGIKRERLCLHSLRHNVSGRLEAAGVSQTDAARVLGHKIAGESYGTYSTGPGLKRLAGVIEDINYPGLVFLAPKT